MSLQTFKQFYSQILLENYKKAEKRFLEQGANPEEVKKFLAFHRNNKDKYDFYNFKPNLRNIDDQKEWKEFINEISPYYLAQLASKSGKRNPELEDIIIDRKLAGLATEYAVSVIKGPFKEAEDIIAKDAEASFYYAFWVLKGRFEKGEDAIAEDGGYSQQYAVVVMRGRFEKGEDAIANNRDAALSYATITLKDPNPETWAKRYLKSK